jgi:hypothetical protein
MDALGGCPPASVIAGLGSRLGRFGAAGHPAGVRDGARLADALLRGVPAAQAFAETGAAPFLSRYVARSQPRDLAALLDGVAPAIARFEERGAALRSRAWYAWALGAMSLAALGVLTGGLMPPLEALVRLLDPAYSPLTFAVVVPLGMSVAFIGSLFAVGAALGRRGARYPFGDARLRQERALVLAAAAAAANAGADLPRAFRAAGEITARAELRRDADALAGALERGKPEGGETLLGELGAALFAAAAPRGAGGETLAALAEFEDAAVANAWPLVLLEAQLIVLVLGALAVGAAGTALILTYAPSFSAIAGS